MTVNDIFKAEMERQLAVKETRRVHPDVKVLIDEVRTAVEGLESEDPNVREAAYETVEEDVRY